MKRAATQLFKRQIKNRAFFKIIELLLWQLPERTPGQERGAKTRPLGQLECANPRGSPGGWSCLELTDTLRMKFTRSGCIAMVLQGNSSEEGDHDL